MNDTAARRAGLAVVVMAGLSLAMAPLNALARMRTDDGRSDFDNPLAHWWADPAMQTLRPLVDWSGPDTVYETYGKFYVFALLAVLACATAVRRRRPSTLRFSERWGWRLTLTSYVLMTVSLFVTYWIANLDLVFLAVTLPVAAAQHHRRDDARYRVGPERLPATSDRMGAGPIVPVLAGTGHPVDTGPGDVADDARLGCRGLVAVENDPPFRPRHTAEHGHGLISATDVYATCGEPLQVAPASVPRHLGPARPAHVEARFGRHSRSCRAGALVHVRMRQRPACCLTISLCCRSSRISLTRCDGHGLSCS